MIPSIVVSYYADKKNIEIEKAQLIFNKLEMFLHQVKNKEVSIPPQDVDEAWHYFILHTKLYSEYCKSELQTFIHHNPSKHLVGAECDAQGEMDSPE